jgi:outer membrane immunogenic protein
VSSKIDYIGSLRGRIGYSWDRALLYGTGGLAWAHHKITLGATFPGFAASTSDDQTHVGWTIGAGLEYAFAPSWSAKVEYLFADYGSENFFSNVIPGLSLAADRQINSVKFGVNYRFGGSAY